jgi:shikimate kinase
MTQHAKHQEAMPSHRSSPASLILIGMRGAGKTTAGRLLANRLNIPFIDTDEIIVTERGMTIAAIFASEGEEGFRRCEVEAVRRATDQSPAVISVGGGAVLNPENVARLQNTGRIVWLAAPAEVLWQRIVGDEASIASRPSLTPRHSLEEFMQLLASRESLYQAAAHVKIDTEGLTPAEVVELILERTAHTM